MARLSIRLLGPVQVSLDGQPVTRFETKKGLALLAYLAVEGGQPQRRAVLAEMLWPGRPEGAARANLRHSLAKLRTAIGDREASPPFLLVTQDTARFNVAGDAWVDVYAFSSLLQGFREKTPASPRRVIHQLEGAVELYRGVFLQDVSVPDSAAFEEWLLLSRERFGRQAQDALRLLVEAYTQIGDHEQALEYARRQVALEPWQEAAQRQVMYLLALNGQRDAALALYQTCRRVLGQELNITPEEETVALYERIRDGASLSPLYPAPPHNLPASPTPFVGRKADLAAIQDRLLDPSCRLLTLVGPGGMGKTRLALAAGAKFAEIQYCGQMDEAAPTFPQGLIFVPLAASGSAEDMAPAIAEACQVRLERGREQLLDYLRQKRLLLILDNLEHLLDGVGLLAEILRTAPGVKVLATSRERLQLHGEHVLLLQGLAFPQQDLTPSAQASLDVNAYVETYPAIKLLVESVRRLQPAFALGPENLVALARVCRLLEGMPLALELAASWADTLALDDILVELEQSLDFLQAEWRDILRRQRSIRAVFDTSWGQLGRAEQALFPQLSVFRGGFTRAAAKEVALGDTGGGPLPRLLSKLAAKSFIYYDQSNHRFQMHELLRQYGAEKLALSPECEAEVWERHSLHFCHWLHQWEASLKDAGQQASLQEIEAELENVRAACEWAAGQGRAEPLSEAVNALGLFYDWRKSYQADEVVFGSLAERLRGAHNLSSPVPGIAQRALARILVWQSKFSRMLGKMEGSERLAWESLALLDAPPLAGQDTRLERAQVWAQLAYLQYGTDLEAARERFLRSRDLYQEVGDRGGLAYVLLGLGRVARNLYAYEEAEEAISGALALRQAAGDQIGTVEALVLLNETAVVQGQFAKAERLTRQSLATIRTAYGLLAQGFTLTCIGRFPEAKAAATESLALYMDQGMRLMGFWALLALAQVHLHLGDFRTACVRGKEALSMAREVGSARNAGLALALLGAVALAEGSYARAQELCEESVSIGPEEPGIQSPRACLGLAARGLGHRDEARRRFLSQLQWALERQIFFPLTFSLAGIALLLADKGEAEKAVEIYALAARYPFVANSRWFEEVAGKEMAAVAAQLSPSAARAARARGQAADLWPAVSQCLERLAGNVTPP